MTDEQRKRLAQLKKANYGYVLAQVRKRNILLQECLDSLGQHCNIVEPETATKCINTINTLLCCHTKGYKRLVTFDEIPDGWIGDSIYIVWDEMTLPILSSNFNVTQKAIEDILAVAFDTWFISENMDKVIHINHDGQIYLFCLDNIN